MKPLYLFPLLLLTLLFSRPVKAGEVIQIGWWSQYAELPTVATMEYHGFTFDEADAFIAVLDCDRVGQFAWIKINHSDWIRAKVFDCLGADGDLSWWRENRVLGELDYYTAQTHGVGGIGGVRAHLAFESDLERHGQFDDLDLDPGTPFVDETTELDHWNELRAIVFDKPTNKGVDVGLVSDVLSVDWSIFEPHRHCDFYRPVEYGGGLWIDSCPNYSVDPILFSFPFGPVLLPGPMCIP